MRNRILFLGTLWIHTASAHEVVVESGSLKGAIAPIPDFLSTTYRHHGYRIGAFTTPEMRGVVASYTTGATPFLLELGQRERSLDQGFLISNGAYLPWTKNFASGEPMAIRTGYETRWFGFDTAYAQRDAENILIARFMVTPLGWLKFVTGAATTQVAAADGAIPLAAAEFGGADGYHGFSAGAQYAGEKNFLLHARYGGAFTLRALAFMRNAENPLASAVYANPKGGVVQYLSTDWFAQVFATDTRYAMVRYAGGYLTAVSVYEDKSQLAGFSVRNNPTGFHVRSGVTIAVDGSIQTLAGFGHADHVFIGGGHYALQGDEPLEPVVFPAAWYSGLLLQSTAMRVRDKGYKMLVMVDTSHIQGFFAATWSGSSAHSEQFGFFMRLAGSLTF